MNRKQRRALRSDQLSGIKIPGRQDGIFQVGLDYHRKGQIADARAVYRQILQADPRNSDALHMLGLIGLQTGRPDVALDLIGRAAEYSPRNKVFRFNLGNAYAALGQFDQAVLAYDAAIALCRGDAQTAGIGAGGLKFDDAEVHFNRAVALGELRRFEDAVASYDTAIALTPNFAEAYSNRGVLLSDLGRIADALASYDKAIALRPNYADAYSNRGNVLRDLKRFADAIASYDKAIALTPGVAELHYNRAGVLSDLHRNAEAVAAYDKAIALQPGHAEAHFNRGAALYDLGRGAEAIASYDKAIALNPGHADAYWNKSIATLASGDLQRGFELFEWRKSKASGFGKTDLAQPEWTGAEDLTGKILFVRWEQGLGDTIQFCRYARLAAARAAHVVLSVQDPLVGLLSQSLTGIEVIGGAQIPAEFDYQAALLSLPAAFQTSLSSVPFGDPYLVAPAAKSAAFATRLGPRQRPRVGLVWNGGFRPDQPKLWQVNERRNVPFELVAQLNRPDIDFISLQKGEPAESQLVEELPRHWPGDNFHVLTEFLQDFSDTAGLIDNLDLVIAVDTSTAHLAAAMGKPVWILNRFDTCWRWMWGRDDSPWYDSVRLFRQTVPGDWSAVIASVASALSERFVSAPRGLIPS